MSENSTTVFPHGGDRYEDCICAWCLAARDPLAIDRELDLLRRVADAAVIQYDCFGAYSGLIDALKAAGYA